MKKTAILFLLLSSSGFIVSLAAHLSTYLGVNPQSAFPWVWLLHAGIFVVLLPLFILHSKAYGSRFGIINHEESVKYAPPWMHIMLKLLAFYMAINFGLFFVLSEGGAPDIWNDRYVLQNKGTFIRELTETEYEAKQAVEVRGFSGHWLVFYFYPMAAYYSYLNKPEEEESTEDCI